MTVPPSNMLTYFGEDRNEERNIKDRREYSSFTKHTFKKIKTKKENRTEKDKKKEEENPPH